jgi:hypothetical protein
MNRIEAQFHALRFFTLDGTDHCSHEEQNSMIRRDNILAQSQRSGQNARVNW